MSYAYSLDAGYVEPSLKSGVAVNTMVGTTIPGGENQSQTGQKPNQITREVIAPPGKLGIVIDTTIQGPVVHKVNKNSPLQGILFPGDIITAIDATDTRSMTASAITALMVQTANQQRRLTVVTDESQ
jgi:C-terminal processing protease CtpA/Prc